MKTTSQRIEPVKKVAQQKERSAAEDLGKANQSFHQAQNKLHELIRYRTDYLAEFQFKAQRGMSGSQLQHFKMFLSQLDKAIEAQQQSIEKAQGEVNKQRQAWQSQHQRKQAVTDYQARMQQKEQLEKSRKESRAQEDDFNATRPRATPLSS